jgi:hypothetical protein
MKGSIEDNIQIDAWNTFGMSLVFVAAEMHPNWEVCGDGQSVRWLGGRGPRSPRGLEKWFMAAYPEATKAIMARINAEVRRGYGRRHLRAVK